MFCVCLFVYDCIALHNHRKEVLINI
ncbi:hypothetical protein F383_35242 [Gossypium arboreum]|uniref:Uncharacterized protein n=1 Tax=Gossypium arboreum TaxID=29729 RepID=A0A0B0N1G8_GOSAR|nr:hypothetical protein F383_35242 [Gossypium arboreum]